MFIDTMGPNDSNRPFMGEMKSVSLLKELRFRWSLSINIAPPRGFSGRTIPITRNLVMRLILISLGFAFIFAVSDVIEAQNPTPKTDALKKVNTRPAETKTPRADPFDGASIEKMSAQCVTLETEQGSIVIEMLPGKAPESVRSFLNLAATGALDTTTFTRVVKDFVIQGGNLSTSENWSAELAARMSRRLPDEPSDVRHVRGIVSMARSDEPNSATTHFFILVGDGPHLDGKFSAFGRVLKGIEVADAINRAPSEGEKPMTPVRIKHAGVAQCQK